VWTEDPPKYDNVKKMMRILMFNAYRIKDHSKIFVESETIQFCSPLPEKTKPLIQDVHILKIGNKYYTILATKYSGNRIYVILTQSHRSIKPHQKGIGNETVILTNRSNIESIIEDYWLPSKGYLYILWI